MWASQFFHEINMTSSGLVKKVPTGFNSLHMDLGLPRCGGGVGRSVVTICFKILFLRNIYWKTVTTNIHKDFDFNLCINRQERREKKGGRKGWKRK